MFLSIERFPTFAYSTVAVHQDMSDCWKCGGARIFIVVFEFENGRAGYCVGCGEERVLPFSRTVAEAA